MSGIYESIGRLFSRQHIRRLGALLESAGSNTSAETFAGAMLLIITAASILSYFFFVFFEPLRSLIVRFSLFISTDLVVESPLFIVAATLFVSFFFVGGAIALLAYVSLLLRADARKRAVEEVLPDFLSLAAANVRAGMTIDQAMWYAAKPEFGILSVEVTNVAKKAFGGVPFNQAIDYLSDRFNSKSIRRAVALIKQGIASGGQLADILERTAEDSRQMQILHKEIAASLLMYVIFILFASVIGTPFLFSISGKLVGILENVVSRMPQDNAFASAVGIQLPLTVGMRAPLSSSDFFFFTILCSIMTAFFSSLIIGVIYKGNKREGIPYIPFLVGGSVLVFFLASSALGSLLSSIYV
ncbi:MAG: type II secretion system F family protein [Candidatus Micrarchaeota archaeon]|nr:type II secretion system F family protein [Candidatus Micrarchaeota archaeon]